MFLSKKTGSIMQRMKGSIIDKNNQTKTKRINEIMKLFLQQTEVKPRHDRLPTAKLRDTADFSVYYSPKEKTPAAKELPIEQQHLWTLAIALLTPDTEEKQLLSLRKWYSQLVQPGLQYFIERNTKKYPDDPFVSVFAHLVFGQRQKAAELAQQQKDFMLGLYICHSELKDLNYIIEEQFHSLKDQPQQQPSSEKQTSWHHMSVHQKKCWYLIAGQFGYSTTDHFAVTDGLYWQLILGLYIWYGTSYGEPVDLNRDYNKMLEKEAAANAMLELQHMHLGEASSTEPSLPDSGILWYQLLQWWCGDSKIADLQAWPLELLWLLSLYKQPNNIDPLFANLWIEELEKEDFANFAIYASLFLPDAEQKIEHILRNGEWSDEDTLITQYHIPKRLIQKAKALNAHDEWDFEAEYKHLLDGQLLDEAKLALIYFVIPKLFESAVSHNYKPILSFIDSYPNREDEDILALKNIFIYVASAKEAKSSKETSFTTADGIQQQKIKEENVTVDKDMLVEKARHIQNKYDKNHFNPFFENLIQEITLTTI